MQRFLTAVLAALVVCMTVEAWGATDQEVFLKDLKKFDVTDVPHASKKFCLCSGGTWDGGVGRLFVSKLMNGRYIYECRLWWFNAQEDLLAFSDCRSTGGSIIPLSR